MNTGKIIIGLALIMFSVALMVSPSNAACPDSPGSGSCGDQGATGNQEQDHARGICQGAVQMSATPADLTVMVPVPGYISG